MEDDRKTGCIAMKKTLHVNGSAFEIEVKDGSEHLKVFVDNRPHIIDLSKTQQNGFASLIVDGEPFEVFCEQKGEAHYLLWIGQNQYEVKFGAAYEAAAEEESVSVIHAPMPGLIAKLNVKEHDTVSKGDSLLILEAMKMQNDLKSPRDGTIQEILIKEGEKVGLQDKLIVLE
jgi:biotin carboxyl carrier protein